MNKNETENLHKLSDKINSLCSTYRGCGNHACWFAMDKSGQMTNGTCSCFDEFPSYVRFAVIRYIQEKNNG